MTKFSLLLFTGLLLCTQAFSQVYTDKVVGAKNETLIDSIESHEYPYVLPIWGKKAAEKGFLLPYSAGLSVTYLWQESALVIDNLMVGFNNGPLYNIDEIVRIEDATSSANGMNFRPDFWLFPFLNVYGILAFAKTSTAIDAGIWMPDADSAWSQVSSFSTVAEFDAKTFGVGFTPSFGVAGAFVVLDMNVAWTDVSALDKPVFTFVFGPRVGKSFKFKNPEMNISGWVGGFRLNYSSETKGSLDLSELIETDELQAKVDQGFTKVEDTYQDVEEWWNGLTPAEQNNPINAAKYNAANNALESASNLLTSVDGALNDGESSTVQYSLDKRVQDKWNFIIGTQFQINRHFMVRAEYGFLGSRQQFIGGLQYRFGL